MAGRLRHATCTSTKTPIRSRATATFKPPHAPAAAYRHVQRELNLARTVVIQPTGYAFDNRCTLAALAELGPEARAIVVVPPDTARRRARIAAWRRRARRPLHDAAGRRAAAGRRSSARAAAIAPLGWHIDLQLDGRELPRHEAMLRRLPCRLAIDHVGRFMGPVEPESAAVLALCRLLDERQRAGSRSRHRTKARAAAPPGYDDIAWIARLVARRFPERCLWASNWPHPNQLPAPSSAAMLDWGLGCMADGAARRKALVDNPAELYGFAAVAAP